MFDLFEAWKNEINKRGMTLDDQELFFLKFSKYYSYVSYPQTW